MKSLPIQPFSTWAAVNGPGIFANVPSELYHRPECGLSRSMAEDLVFRSPAHMVENVRNPKPPTPFMAFGSLVHCATLEPDKLADLYCVQPDSRPAEKDCKAVREGLAKPGDPIPWDNKTNYCKSWNAEHADRFIITAEDEKKMHGCVRALRGHPLVNDMLTVGQPELSVFTRINGLQVRCRPDLMAYDREGLLWVLDIKKLQDASHWALLRRARSMHFDFQEAWYRVVLEAEGLEVHRFVFVAVEEEPPHGVVARYISRELVQDCYPAVHLAMDLYQQCQEQQSWPGYDDRIESLHWKYYERP